MSGFSGLPAGVIRSDPEVFEQIMTRILKMLGALAAAELRARDILKRMADSASSYGGGASEALIQYYSAMIRHLSFMQTSYSIALEHATDFFVDIEALDRYLASQYGAGA